jgi:hypothetical protein
MNKENPHLFELKMLTYQSIQELMYEKSMSQTQACRHFYAIVENKKTPCGFKVTTFQKFHNNFRKFKERKSK